MDSPVWKQLKEIQAIQRKRKFVESQGWLSAQQRADALADLDKEQARVLAQHSLPLTGGKVSK